MGKNLLLLAAAVLILPSALRADSSVAFLFSGGTVVGTNSGLSLSGSTIGEAVGLGGPAIFNPNLGTVNFMTGALQSGTPEGGVFLPGGSFTLVGSGTNGVPAGVLFSGAFNQRTGWTPVTFPDGTHYHVLHGVLDGTWMGVSVTDIPMEFQVYTQGASFSSAGQRMIGSIQLPAVVPEPDSLAFIALGSLGLGGALMTRFGAFRSNALPQTE